jgi:hypothetical protein
MANKKEHQRTEPPTEPSLGVGDLPAAPEPAPLDSVPLYASRLTKIGKDRWVLETHRGDCIPLGTMLTTLELAAGPSSLQFCLKMATAEGVYPCWMQPSEWEALLQRLLADMRWRDGVPAADAREAAWRYGRMLDDPTFCGYQDDNDGAAWARVEAWARSRGCTLEAEATEREKAPRKPGDDARNEFPHDEFEAWLKSINENPGWYRRDDYSCEDDDGPRSEKGGKGDER